MIDHQDNKPLHEQVQDIIRSQISDGQLVAGDQLPAEPELAESIGVSRATVRRAFDSLEAEGVIERWVGRGTFVAGTEAGTIGRSSTARQPDMDPERVPLVLGIDAGGTMTDTFIVDTRGRFTIGKAATTPQNESLGFIESSADAAKTWGIELDELFAQLEVTLYSGTALLNTLLTHTGKRLGLIITRGFEDAVMMGTGIHVWDGYGYSDRLHAVTHMPPPLLVPRERIRGVTERVDLFGDPVIPIYEQELQQGIHELLDDNIEALCICFLFSHVNAVHEERARAAAEAIMAERGIADVPIYTSAAVRPIVREQFRLNSLLVEAFAATRGRDQLFGVEQAIEAHGFRFPLQVVLSYGGLANIRYPRLHETLVSGPVGGIMGARYVGEVIGAQNIVVTDMGGTSFDIGAITAGTIPIDNEPTLARLKLNLPTIAMDSIGAGGGTIIKVDPVTQRLHLGPESAGASPGPVCFDQGGTEPTITDCNLVLGIINRDYFLGGQVRLDVEKAKEVLRNKVTDVIGVDLYAGAEGILRLLESETRDALLRVVRTRGLEPADYYLMSYGGAGPLHMAGYSQSLGFKGVMTFPFAAAFSAFGCTTADYLHRYSRSVQFTLPFRPQDDLKTGIAAQVSEVWQTLMSEARDEMIREGHPAEAITFQALAMMRYGGQLEDIEVASPLNTLQDADDLDTLIAAFETLYEKINRRVARYPEAGYEIKGLGILSRVEKIKPRFVRQPLGAAEPTKEASKGERAVYYDGQWHQAKIYEVDELRPGNKIDGLAVLEHPATTMMIPPHQQITVDEWNIFWLQDIQGQVNE
jgi:N-methylhydantoinase A